MYTLNECTNSHTHTYTHSHTIHSSIAPSDYGALAGFSLGPFSDSVRRLSFNVSIVDDMIPEDNELFTASLTLSDPATYGEIVTVDPALANVTILDEDGKSLIDCDGSTQLHISNGSVYRIQQSWRETIIVVMKHASQMVH